MYELCDMHCQEKQRTQKQIEKEEKEVSSLLQIIS